jgi:putative sugar O-methyltransferase
MGVNKEHLKSATSISHSYKEYKEICLNASNDDVIFNTFKSLPYYMEVLEHASYENGLDHLNNIIHNNPDLLNLLDKFLLNDKYGSPNKHTYFIPPENKELICSPTTLQYISILGDLKKIYNDLNNIDIIEIGGGYGGQCKIIFDLFKPKSYTIIDIKEPCLLIKKYLAMFNIFPKVIDAEEFSDNPEVLKSNLVISNFAFSEVFRPQQDIYIDCILNYSQCGYMVCNQISSSIMWKSASYSIVDFKEKIKKNIHVFADIPSENKLNYRMIW